MTAIPKDPELLVNAYAYKEAPKHLRKEYVKEVIFTNDGEKPHILFGHGIK